VDEATGRHPSVLGPVSPAVRRLRGRWTLLGAVLAAVALLAVLFSFGLGRDPTQLRSNLIGRPAPRFDLPGLSGGSGIDLAGLRGQVVVVNFFASWCAECRVEHDDLAAAWARYRDQGVVFVGIPFQDQPAASRAFATQIGMDWPVLSDPDSSTALRFGVYGVPETFLIGRDGTLRYRYAGPVDYGSLTDRIAGLLSERAR
jgi:cytochrome c biogenesis protein CcmG/thiol:disulfide interchange protein DsbE